MVVALLPPSSSRCRKTNEADIHVSSDRMPHASMGTQPRESIWLLHPSANRLLYCVCLSCFSCGCQESTGVGLGVRCYCCNLQSCPPCSPHTGVCCQYRNTRCCRRVNRRLEARNQNHNRNAEQAVCKLRLIASPDPQSVRHTYRSVNLMSVTDDSAILLWALAIALHPNEVLSTDPNQWLSDADGEQRSVSYIPLRACT